MNYILFIDDERFPPRSVKELEKPNKLLVIARNTIDAICLMEINGCPDMISFDHDLGGEDTAMKIVHWMINRDLDFPDMSFIPCDFSFYVHSQNPVGAKNITELLNSYLRQRNSNNGNIYLRRN